MRYPITLVLRSEEWPEEDLSIKTAVAKRPHEALTALREGIRELVPTVPLDDLRTEVKLLELELIFRQALTLPYWDPPNKVVKVLQACRNGQLDSELEGRYFQYAGAVGVIAFYLATKDDTSVFSKITSLTEEAQIAHFRDVARLNNYNVRSWVDTVFNPLKRLPLFDVPPTFQRPRVRKNVSKSSTDKSADEQNPADSTSLPHNSQSNPYPSNQKRKQPPLSQIEHTFRYDIQQTSNTNPMLLERYKNEYQMKPPAPGPYDTTQPQPVLNGIFQYGQHSPSRGFQLPPLSNLQFKKGPPQTNPAFSNTHNNPSCLDPPVPNSFQMVRATSEPSFSSSNSQQSFLSDTRQQPRLSQQEVWGMTQLQTQGGPSLNEWEDMDFNFTSGRPYTFMLSHEQGNNGGEIMEGFTGGPSEHMPQEHADPSNEWSEMDLEFASGRPYTFMLSHEQGDNGGEIMEGFISGRPSEPMLQEQQVNY